MNNPMRVQAYQQACMVLGIDLRIATEISRLGARCARQYPNSGLHADDWIQTLWAGLLRGLASYKSEQASQRTFARRLIQHEAISLIRQLRAGKRDCGRSVNFDENSVDEQRVLNCAGQNASRRNRTLTSLEKIEFWIDVKSALMPMRSDGRRAVLMLGRFTVMEVCERTGRSRAWVYRNVRKAQACLQAAGIDRYYFRRSKCHRPE
jgi:RNA polymerase sigma factor (sigma-70 family)